jgi:zinc protease
VIPVIERGQIDGVPVLRSDAPAGRTMAALVFRVGHFDETLPISGITHMVEHLTFAGRPEARYHFNASVSGRYTSFHVESPEPDDVRDFVETVCRGLAADHRAVIDRERMILRTEAASRGGAGALGSCLAERYGATGPGLANYREFGLLRLGWPDVEAWRRRWFTAGNAVLWIAGPVPYGLRVSLPYGAPPPAQGLRPLGLTLPAYTTGARGGVAMSLVSPRAIRYRVTLDVLQRRLTQVLRHEYGTTYGVQLSSEELDRDLMHSWVAADALAEQTPMAAHGMLTTFQSLCAAGCEYEEIKDYVRRAADAYESPAGPAMLLQGQAHALLSGRPVRDARDLLRAADETTPQDVGRAAQALYDQMLVATPGVLPAVQGRMGMVPAWSSRTVTGKQHKSADSDAVLTTGDDGVMLTGGPGKHVTVRYDSVAALLRWNDGRQALVGDDGFVVQLDPDEWPGGRAVPDSVAARVRPDVVIDLAEPGSPRPGRGTARAKKDTSQQSAERKPAAARAHPRRRLIITLRVLYAVLILAGIAGAVAGLPQGIFLSMACAAALVRTEMQYGRWRR